MLHKWNRFLSFLLAIALVTTTFGSDFATARAYAVEGIETDLSSDDDGMADLSFAEEVTESNEESAQEVTEVTEPTEPTQEVVEEPTADEETQEEITEEETSEEEITEETEEEEPEETETVVEEKLVKVTYKASKGGRVSTSSEEVDINKEDAAFQGSTATAWNDKYTFVDWTDEDGNQVSTDATFVPSDVTEDATFTANFLAAEDIETAMPAISADNVKAGDMIVSVSADPGLFPEGTEIVISAVDDDTAVELAEKSLGEGNVKKAKAVDITFKKDGVELQPADSKYVHVSISFDEAIESNDAVMLHEHDGEVNEIEKAAVSDTGAEFDANKFSIFIVAEEGQSTHEEDEKAVLTYNFYINETDTEAYNTQYVKQGETLADPGIPTLEKDQEFFGWFYTEGDQEVKVTFGEVGKVESQKTINAYAKIKTTYYVTFIGSAGEVVQVLKKTTTDTTKPVEITKAEMPHYEPAKDTQTLKGWSKDKDTRTEEEMQSGADDRAVVDKIDARKDKMLYAVVVDAFWITFDENDDAYQGETKISSGGASYTAPIHVEKGNAPSTIQAEAPVPTRPGYTFKGWYTGQVKTEDESAGMVTGDEFNWNTPLTQDTTVYAKWEANQNTTYTVILWQQKITDSKDTTDNTKKTYDFKASYTLNAATGTTLNENSISSYKSQHDEGFHYKWFEVVYLKNGIKTVTDSVRAKGDTVINVYFDRDLMTIDFQTYKSSGWGGSWSTWSKGKYTGLYGQTLAQNGYSWPTEYRWTNNGTVLTYLNAFLFKGLEGVSADGTTLTQYGYAQSGDNKIRFYTENLDGTWYMAHETTSSGGAFGITNKYNGFEAVQYRTSSIERYVSGREWVDGYWGWGGWHDGHYEDVYSEREVWSEWADAVAGTGNNDGTTVPTGYVDLEIRFARKSYSLSFKDNFNGTTSDVTDVDDSFDAILFEQKLNSYENLAPKLANLPGYTFKGWYEDQNGQKKFNWDSVMPAANKVLYAHYEKDRYHISLKADGGVLPEGQIAEFDLDYGDKIEKESIYRTTKAGYELVGWFDDKTGFAYDFAEITEDVNLTAKWRNPGTVNIVYDAADHGSNPFVDEYNYATNSAVVVAAPPATIEDGYTFIGWMINGDSKNTMYYPNNSFEITSDIIKDKKVTLTAQYQKTGAPGSSTETTTITYKANGGVGNDKVVGVDPKLFKNEGVKALTLAEAGFTRANYKFLGWSKTSDGQVWLSAEELAQGVTIAADNLPDADGDGNPDVPNTLYAIWEKMVGSYTIEYYKGEITNNTDKVHFIYKTESKQVDVGTEIRLTLAELNYKKPTMGYQDGVQQENVPYVIEERDDNVIYVLYKPVKVTVTITGNTATKNYTGSEQSVAGYTVSISGDGYTENDFAFVGAEGVATVTEDGKLMPAAKGTNVGPYTMGLTKDCFENRNSNFTDVNFVIASDGQLTIDPIDVTVTIKGKTETAAYDGEEHKQVGYDVEISNAIYKESDFTFTPAETMTLEGGKPVAARTDAGKTMMGLAEGQFANTNNNFRTVTFNVTDGYVEITKIDVTVTITGRFDSRTYDGQEHTVTGYDVQISNSLYKESDFTFSGTAEAKRKDAGKTDMGLEAGQFKNNNDNFDKVTFTIAKDGYQEIIPVEEVKVTIVGKNNTADYDGQEHAVTGYDITISDELYKESDFIFDYDGDGQADRLADKAVAKRTDAGETKMGLSNTQFKNNNNNFKKVVFEVTDGYQKIDPISVIVTIKGSTGSYDYDGKEKSVSGYDVSFSNALYTEDDFKFTGTTTEVKRTDAGKTEMGLTKELFVNSNNNFKDVEFAVTDGYVEIKKINATVTIVGNSNTSAYDGEKHSVSGYTATASSDLYKVDGETKDFTFSGTASAERTDAGKTDMGLAASQFKNTNTNFETVTFEVTDGYQEITPIDITVTIVGNNSSVDYDGSEHVVTGYEVTDISNTLYKESDITFSGTAESKRTDAGKTMMGLTPDMFGNSNKNFDKVTFNVTDGYQEIKKINVTVTITGNTLSVSYDNKEHSVTGYTAKADSTLYDVENDFTFSGEASAEGIDAKKYPMGLVASQFSNQNANFDKVTFNITDGYLEIKPIDVTVTITGKYNSTVYDGEEHEVTGYTATASSDLYKVDGETKDFTFSGTAAAKRKDVGKTNMNLDASQFANQNTNFDKVTFNVTDGYQEITAVDEVVVTITGHNNTTDYDGKDHTVTGYDVEISNKLYKESDFTFSGTASATRKDAGKADMGLKAEQFKNNNANFAKVIFNVTDGYQAITPINVTVTIVGDSVTTDYDGQEHVARGYKVTDISNNLFKESDVQFHAENYENGAVAKRTNAGTTYIGLTKTDFYTSNSNFGEVTFNVTDGFVTINPIDVTVTIVGNNNTTDYDGTSHTVSGYTATANSTLYDVENDFTFSGTASATQKDAGTKKMGLASEQFVNQNNNFKKVTFEVTDGYQTINPIDVTVTIVGNNNTADYDGTSHTVSGYTATANSTLYDVENDFTFSGTAEAARTDAGTTKMNLAPEQFVNQNNNFKKVTFEVTDGFVIINPIDVTVTIVGNNNTTDYDGTSHTVSGYTATANSTLYDVENDFTFSGTAEAARTDAGTTKMNLAPEQFVNQNNNFKKVTFEVTDGYQTINPIDVTVTIVGANNTATYDGEDHTVTGYTATASSTLYDVDKDFIFRPAQNVVVNEKGEPTATRKNEGTTNMNLAAEQFANNNNNFKTVTFNVTDGYQTITAVNEVVVTITGHNNTTDYDGKDHTVTGYDVEINNPLYTTADFTFSGNASATQKDAGTKKMGLAAEQFANKNSNFAKVTFNVTDGYQTVNPIDVTVTITGNNDTKDYDGQDHTVTDYSVQISNPLYTEADFEFTGTASATQKDAGTKKMGLASEQFVNKNTNFKAVTFNVTDGYMTINPIDVTVTVVGNKVETAYDGQEHTAEGYNVTNISTTLYTTSDFEFTGKAKVSRTEAGKSEMGLTAEQFANKNTNFKTVTFNVTDGYVDISKIDVTVKIVGNTVTEDYDGTEHVAESYEVKEISSELYTKNDFAFSGEAKAARTNAGQTDMGLTASMFTNNNQNFGTVTFDITDGYVKINKINATVSITGHNDTKDYAGTEYGVQGYDVTKISTDLYTANDFSFTGEATASREDAGTTYMELSEDDFTNNNENFETVTFDVTDGYITINPIAVKVEIVGANSTDDFNGAEHVVSGFTATASSDLYDTSADMTFTPAPDMDLENGQPAARRTNYGTTNMNLAGSMFANTNDNFTNVVFEVTDGYQTIGAIDAEVTIKGTIVTEVYNGKVHTAKGYTAKANTDLYDVKKFIDFNGAALAEITNAGTEYMGLTPDMFSNNNENFSNVRFVVTDGYVTVEPAKVVVKVTGNNDTVDYDGKVHTVTGYKVKFEDAPDAAAGNIIVDLVSTTGKDIYKEEFISFTGTDKVEESKTGKHMMNLAAEQFANTNDNFDVTFEVEDGYLEINPVSFDIIASTLDDSKIYSGKTWTGADFDYILTGNKSENKNPLGRVIDAATDFVKDLISPLMVVAADEENPHAVTIGDTEYTVSGLNVDVNAKDVKADGYVLDIVGKPVITDPQGNDVTDMFNLTYDKGTLMITPAPVTVTANSYSRTTAQSDPTLTAVVKADDENLQAEAEDSINYNISRAAGNAVGTYAITATPVDAELLEDGTYLQGNFKVTYVPGTLTITAAPSGGGDTPSDPTPIPDAPTPTAAAPAGVLGARREDALTDGAAVLGARRGRTEDEANTNARVFAIVMAVAAAITALIAGKKKEEEED